jgi:uncharacterized phage protein (TIGR01671 family)
MDANAATYGECKMRELKFRGWNGYNMILPRDGAYYQHHVSFCGGIVQKSSEGMECFGGGDRWNRVDNLKLMQFTGLQDKNGVDIYEGDIVSLWYAPRATAKGKIKFENGGFYFKTTEAKPEIALAYNCVYEYGNSFTVIGNIHQNPELLESVK